MKKITRNPNIDNIDIVNNDELKSILPQQVKETLETILSSTDKDEVKEKFGDILSIIYLSMKLLEVDFNEVISDEHKRIDEFGDMNSLLEVE